MKGRSTQHRGVGMKRSTAYGVLAAVVVTAFVGVALFGLPGLGIAFFVMALAALWRQMFDAVERHEEGTRIDSTPQPIVVVVVQPGALQRQHHAHATSPNVG